MSSLTYSFEGITLYRKRDIEVENDIQRIYISPQSQCAVHCSQSSSYETSTQLLVSHSLYEGSWSLLLALDTFDFVAFSLISLKAYEILSIFE